MRRFLIMFVHALLASMLMASCVDSATNNNNDDDEPAVESYGVTMASFAGQVVGEEQAMASFVVELSLQYDAEHVSVQGVSLSCYNSDDISELVAISQATTSDGYRYAATIDGLLSGDYTVKIEAEYAVDGVSVKEEIASRTFTVTLQEQPEPEPEPEPEASKEAILTYKEAAEAEAVEGYGAPMKYTNDYGEWVICAYNTGSAIQLNSNKVAYVGTPTFDATITSLTISTTENYTDYVYICGEAGTTAPSQVLLSEKCTGRTTTIDVSSIRVKKFYLRSSACIRIESLKLLYGGNGGETPDPDPDPDPTPDPDPDPTPDPTPDTTGLSWAELPVITDSNGDGRIDSDNTLYYAHHICNGNERNAQGGKARNYTVCYSSKYHCPVWVAAPRHEMYQKKGTNRTDAYGKDPKIPSSIQYSSKSTGGGCNKGHMLGSAERISSAATNRQVFYYTNIAPQYSSTFNTGGGAWNNLEDHVDGLVCKDTLYVVIGCYFDKFSRNGKSATPAVISFGGRNDVTRPTMFYYALLRTKRGSTGKRVQDCSASELQCAAFVICHEEDKGHKPGAADMMSISDLEALTGFTYFKNVPNAPKSTYNASDWL